MSSFRISFPAREEFQTDTLTIGHTLARAFPVALNLSAMLLSALGFILYCRAVQSIERAVGS
jgi:hypothetical protein